MSRSSVESLPEMRREEAATSILSRITMRSFICFNEKSIRFKYGTNAYRILLLIFSLEAGWEFLMSVNLNDVIAVKAPPKAKELKWSFKKLHSASQDNRNVTSSSSFCRRTHNMPGSWPCSLFVTEANFPTVPYMCGYELSSFRGKASFAARIQSVLLCNHFLMKMKLLSQASPLA